MAEIIAATSACLFVDGQHVIAGKNCPHGDTPVDEPPPDWTVQTANRKALA